MNEPPGGRPVRASDRVNDVLARDEALVEVFIRHSEHFRKLRNRSLRRIMGRLATVEDASRLAAVEVDALLRDLNAVLGLSAEIVTVSRGMASSSRPSPSDKTHPAGARVMDVDVRADLRQGREPLARIMTAVSALEDEDVLHLRTLFEPVPLFAVLSGRGFLHESQSLAADDWSVWFWRVPARSRSSLTSPASAWDPTPTHAQHSGSSPADTEWLDVRGLAPPEPLVQTLAALDALADGHQLIQLNDRVPELLLPMLAERGYACELDASHTDPVLVRIWRPA